MDGGGHFSAPTQRRRPKEKNEGAPNYSQAQAAQDAGVPAEQFEQIEKLNTVALAIAVPVLASEFGDTALAMLSFGLRLI